MRTNPYWFLPGLLIAASVSAQPADPAAPAAALQYESAFSGYRAQQDLPLLLWQQLFTAEGEFAGASAQSAPMDNTTRKPQEDHSGHGAHKTREAP